MGEKEITFVKLFIKTVAAVWSLQQTGFESIFFTLPTLLELFFESRSFDLPVPESSGGGGIKLYVDIIALVFSSTQMLLYANLPDHFFYINLLMPILFSCYSDKGEGRFSIESLTLYLSIFVPLMMILFAASRVREVLLEAIVLIQMYLLLLTKLYENYISEESTKSAVVTVMNTVIMLAAGQIAVKNSQNKETC